MPMNAALLAEEIMDAMEGQGLAPRNPKAEGKSEKIWIAVAEAVVAHIQTNGITLTPVTGGSSAGAYPGTIS